jgi:DNA end-binding protein Ku
MAESYIAALSGDFEPDQFTDNYREALEEVIDAKIAGREVKAPVEAPRSGQVVDLMEALRRSVAEAKSKRGEASAGSASAGSASAAKKTAKKSSASGAKKTASKTAKAPAKKAAGQKSAASKAAKSAKAAKKTAKKAPARRTA